MSEVYLSINGSFNASDMVPVQYDKFRPVNDDEAGKADISKKEDSVEIGKSKKSLSSYAQLAGSRAIQSSTPITISTIYGGVPNPIAVRTALESFYDDLNNDRQVIEKSPDTLIHLLKQIL